MISLMGYFNKPLPLGYLHNANEKVKVIATYFSSPCVVNERACITVLSNTGSLPLLGKLS